MSDKEPYYGDLEKTRIIWELCQMSKEERDREWQRKFWDNVTEASFRCGDPQIKVGPDGFPYFQLFLPEPGEPFQSFVISKMKDDFLLDRGFGVVINPDKAIPDWVFTYGDIVNLHVRNEYYSPYEGPEDDENKLSQSEEVLVAQPSQNYFPAKARAVLKNYLNHNGISNPRLLLMGRKRGDKVYQELVFDLLPDQFPSPEHHRVLMQSLAWFLPRHYSYASLHNEEIEPYFQPL